MKAFVGIAVAFVVLLVAGPALADTVIFSDDFNSENGGNQALNYNSFANWNVTDGTVDLLGAGVFAGACIAAGGAPVCVDLDGSTNDAGIMTTKTSFSFLAGQTYDLTFDLAGSPSSDNNTVLIEVEIVPLSLTSITVLGGEPFSTRTITVMPLVDATGPISFENLGGDNIGALLDNVVLSLRTEEVVPEPAAAVLAATGLFGVFAFRGRRLGRRAA